MRTAGITDLKARLSEYLAAVKAGEEILVTERGISIARIAPLAPPETEPTNIVVLEKAGLLKRPTRPLTPSLFKGSRPDDPEDRVRAALLAEREEGW